MVTAQTTKFVKQIQSDMRFKGWKYKRSIASAQEELIWSNDKHDFDIVLTGWHGTKGWGPQRIMHTLMTINKKTYRLLSEHIITDLDNDLNIKGDCSMTPKAAAKYQTKLDQTRTKIIELIG